MMDFGYLSNTISEASSWVSTLSWIFLGVGAVLFMITIITIISYISYSLEHEKRTIGILASLGVKIKSIANIFILDVVGFVTLSFVIASFLEIFVIKGLNTMIIKTNVSTVNSIFFDFLAFMSIISFVLLITLLTMFIFLKKLSSKETVDIIYNR